MAADDFIIANEDLALELDAKLEELPFRDKDTFVQMYNSGLINRKNDQVSSLVDELIAAYKGIERRTDGIVFLDMGEISADELVARAEAYSLLLRLQRVAKEAAANRQLRDGSLVYIGKGNILHRAGEQNEEGRQTEDEAISSEKLPRISTEAVAVVGSILGVEDYDLGKPFEANRLLSVRSQPVIDALAALS